MAFRSLRWVVFGIAAMGCLSAGSAWAHRVIELKVPRGLGANVAKDPARVLVEHGSRLGIHPDSELVHAHTNHHDGADYVRFHQRVNGLPVLGGQAVVRMQDGQATLLSSSMADGAQGCASSASVDPASFISEEDARHTVASTLNGGIVDRAELMQVPMQGCLIPSWVVEARTFQPFGSWRYIVDAATGELAYRHSLLDHATGRIFAVSPSVPANATTTVVTLPNLTSTTQLVGTFVDAKKGVVAANGQLTASRLAVPDGAGNYLFTPTDPSLTDAFSEVQMYYHVSLFHQHLKTDLNFARPGAIQSIQAFTNYTERGQGLANAFFGDVDGDGRGDMAFGQASIDFAYDATVIYHEFTHSVVASLGGLNGPAVDGHGIYEEPGALNEAFADYFATSFTGNPLLGQYAARAFGQQVVRRMDLLKKCPDDFVGEIHVDGVVWGSTLWAVRTALGAQLADKIIYATLDALTPDASIATAGQVLLSQTGLLSGGNAANAQNLVRQILQDHGVTGCERFVPLLVDDGTGANDRRGFIYGQSDFNLANTARVPAGIQYKIDVPANANQLQIRVSDPSGGAGPTAQTYRLLVRKDAPVAAAFIAQGGARFDYVADFIDTSAGGNAPVTMTTQGGSLRLAPGSSYYILVANSSASAGAFQVRATSTFDPNAALQSTDAAGTATAEPNGSGEGGCNATHTAGDATFALLLAYAALTLVRSRRKLGNARSMR